MNCAHAQLSIDAIFDRMQPNTITGATVITHGFTLNDDGGGYMLPLAQAIRNRLLSQSGGNVWLLDYDLVNDGATGEFNASTSVLPPIGSSSQSGHAILLHDWGPESNETSRWWAETAGDALFALGTGIGMFNPAAKSSAPVQFIGHSFGTVTTTEAVERLAGYGVPVDQVTLIDPHDFDQPGVPNSLSPNFDGLQRMFELGAPDGYGATIWDNVIDADVYYQTRGNQGGFVSLGTADPEGRPLAGAYNRHLDGAEELPAGNPYGIFGTGSDHGYTWNTFYTATVTGVRPTGSMAPADSSLDYTQTGWGHSIHNTERVPTPAANFYGSDQDHEWSEPLLVQPGGSPNPTGLAQLGLTSQQVTDARWAPAFQPGDIANGDFESGSRTSVFVDLVAGWSHHGGGGDSKILTESTPSGDNRFMRLDTSDDSRTHNYTYIPDTAEALLFDLRIPTPSVDDVLHVLMGNTLLAVLDLTTAVTDWTLQAIPIPQAFRDTVRTFSLDLVFGANTANSPQVDFDNFRFAIAPRLAGDFNDDGRVDAADYTLWRDQLGSNLPLPNDDQLGAPIGNAHYELWRANFGATSASLASGAGAVPEPATWLVLLSAMLLIAAKRPVVFRLRLRRAER